MWTEAILHTCKTSINMNIDICALFSCFMCRFIQIKKGYLSISLFWNLEIEFHYFMSYLLLLLLNFGRNDLKWNFAVNTL